MKKHKKTRRPGSGRTTGSYSFVKLTINDLLAKFADHDTPVIMGRKWAEAVGFKGLPCGPAGALTDSIQGQTPNTKVGATVRNLDEE